MASIAQQENLPHSGPSMVDSFKQGVRSSGLPWAFIAPSLIVMLIISFVPQPFQIYISFRDFNTQNLNGTPAAYVGLNNYAHVLSGQLNIPNYSFFPLLGFNIVWTLVNVLFHASIGLAVALALNSKFVIGRRIYRAVFILPWALPGYITALIWNNLWQQHGGGVNLLAESLNRTFGFHIGTDTDWLGSLTPPVDLRTIIPAVIIIGCGILAVWLALRLKRLGLRNESGKLDTDRMVFNLGGLIITGAAAIFTLLDAFNGSLGSSPIIGLFDRAGAPVLAFYAVLIANIWLGWPFMMVVATGALQSISPEMYEAADVDGASKWTVFWKLTLPLIRPAMVPAIMLGTIWTFNQFSVIFFITGGNPRGQTDLLITQSYKLIQQEQLYGAAAAFSIIVFFVLLIITLINNRVTRATESAT